MQPTHAGAEMLLMQRCNFALEGTGFSRKMQSEIGFTKHGARRCRKQREADGRRSKLNQSKTSPNRCYQRLSPRRKTQFVAAQEA